MANIGLNNFRYSILTEAADGTPSYAGAIKPAKAVSCTVTPTNNSAKLYADDALAESDTSFSNASVSMGFDDADDTTMAALLGHTVSEGEMVRNTDDVAPYVGIGRILTKLVGGTYKYKVEILYKVKFAEPSQENNTKGESVEFSTPTIEGTATALANGDWSKTKTFTSKTDAVSYLESAFAAATTA